VLFSKDTHDNNLYFVYKYGVPNDADIVLDFSNPFFVKDLNELTSDYKVVSDYVLIHQKLSNG